MPSSARLLRALHSFPTRRSSDLQRLPLEILHDQVIDAVLMADVVQRADIRMGEAGDGLRLAFESEPQLRVFRKRGGEHLHRDGAIEPRVARTVDLAHAAGADGRDDLV